MLFVVVEAKWFGSAYCVRVCDLVTVCFVSPLEGGVSENVMAFFAL